VSDVAALIQNNDGLCHVIEDRLKLQAALCQLPFLHDNVGLRFFHLLSFADVGEAGDNLMSVAIQSWNRDRADLGDHGCSAISSAHSYFNISAKVAAQGARDGPLFLSEQNACRRKGFVVFRDAFQ